jgi:hypothetical protein
VIYTSLTSSRPGYFAYSRHATRTLANNALDDYFAQGLICEAEQPFITKCGRGKRPWLVMFPGV